MQNEPKDFAPTTVSGCDWSCILNPISFSSLNCAAVQESNEGSAFVLLAGAEYTIQIERDARRRQRSKYLRKFMNLSFIQ